MEQRYWRQLLEWIRNHPGETAFVAAWVTYPHLPFVRTWLGCMFYGVLLIAIWEHFGLAEAFGKLWRR